METISILGVKISNITFVQGIETVREWITASEKHCIVTPNPEFVMRALHDPDFLDILNKADLAIPDGTGLIWAGKILGTPFKEKITGVDFMLGLCKMAEGNGFTVGLLGAGEGVALRAAETLRREYPGLTIVFIAEEWDQRKVQSSKFPYRVNKVQSPGIDLLFVAFGAPKQEKWIASHMPEIPVKVAMGVGGSFDYLAGVVPLAPSWIRNLGFEWLYRLVHEPRRFGRQLSIWKFGFLVWKNKIFQTTPS